MNVKAVILTAFALLPQIASAGTTKVRSTYDLDPDSRIKSYYLEVDNDSQAFLSVDINQCEIDAFGNTTVCTELAGRSFSVKLVELDKQYNELRRRSETLFKVADENGQELKPFGQSLNLVKRVNHEGKTSYALLVYSAEGELIKIKNLN